MGNNHQAVYRKIERLVSGGRLRILDLFSGCGGLSLGFHRAGFQISAAVEFDPSAAASHGLNFHCGDLRHRRTRDISKLSLGGLVSPIETVPVSPNKPNL